MLREICLPESGCFSGKPEFPVAQFLILSDKLYIYI